MFKKILQPILKPIFLTGITLHLFSICFGQTNTLLGQWKMNEGSGTVLVDASGNGNNATLQNAKDIIWATGKESLALYLPGTSSRFAIASNQASLNIADKITIAGWIKPTSNSNMAILAKNSSDGYELKTTSSGKIEFKFNATTNGTTYRILSNASYPTDDVTWMHVAATYDGTTSKIYINGLLDQSVTFSTPVPIVTNTAGLYIGAMADGSYRWKGSLDDLRLYSGALDATAISQLAGVTLSPPATPTLSAPADGSYDIPYNQTLNWNAVSGVNQYEVVVSQSSTFATQLLQNTITNASIQLTDLLPGKIYYWRVRAINSVGNGSWSATWSFTTMIPPPTGTTLVANWKMNEGSGAVLIDNSGNNNNATLQNTSGISWVIGKDGQALNLPGTSNRLAVVPNQASLNVTNKITIAAWIQPIGSGNMSILSKSASDGYELKTNSNGKIEFKFNGTTNGTTYRIYSNTSYPTDGITWMHVAATYDGSSSKIYINGLLDQSVTFSSPVPIITNTSGLYIGALTDGSYRWKGSLDELRLYNGTLDATEILQLAGALATPTLSTPTNGAVGATSNQTLTWNAVSNVTKYRVEVSTVATFATTFSITDNVTATSLALSGLASNTLYYWRVRADNANTSSNWSSVWNFTTLAPVPVTPTLTAPANAITNVPLNPTLSWNSVNNATKYRVEVSKVSDFATTVLVQDDIQSTSFTLTGLSPSTVYYWRVRAGNIAGNSSWAAARKLTTFSLPLISPVLTAPISGTTNTSFNQIISWVSVIGADRYRVEVSESSTFATPLFAQDTITGTSLQLWNLLPSKVYYWRVCGIYNGGNGNWSAAWQFTTTNTKQLTGFTTVTQLDTVGISGHLADVPQAKVWKYANKWWTVLATEDGTKIFRLDGTAWTPVLTISTSSSPKADCWVQDNVTHILLFKETNPSYLVSVEYDAAGNTYKLWNQRPAKVNLTLDTGIETAVLCVDGNGRMWIANAGVNDVYVRWSDAPYSTFSAPITVATGIKDDDICAITTLPGKIGVFWSNQNTKLFGFKTHTNGADPAQWSADETPSAQSALNIKYGMADDHYNIKVSGDGTLYCSVKTGYNTPNYPQVMLLVRRPSGVWDNPYPVALNEGSRPIVVLNEAEGKIKVIYTTTDSTRYIVYNEASIYELKFGSPRILIGGDGRFYEYATSTHQNYDPEIVILATETTTPRKAVGVIASDGPYEISSKISSAISDVKVKLPAAKVNPALYPDPVQEQINLDFRQEASGRIGISIMDASGRIYVRTNKTVDNNKLSLDLSGYHLKPGIYFLTIRTSSGNQVLKFLKH